jgi:hypothetical protein
MMSFGNYIDCHGVNEVRFSQFSLWGVFMSRLMFFPAEKRFEGFLSHFPEGYGMKKKHVWSWRHIVVRLLCP